MTGTSKVFVCTGDGTIRTFKEVAGGSVPVKDKDFTYSGNCEVIDDTDEVLGTNWRIKFLTSGVLTLKDERLVDVFLVGGGGNGGTSNYSTDNGSGRGFYCGGAGGGGGYTKTVSNITLEKEIGINIIIPSSTGSASIIGYDDCSVSGGASGGAGIWYNSKVGGDGGSGGGACNYIGWGSYYTNSDTGGEAAIGPLGGTDGADGRPMVVTYIESRIEVTKTITGGTGQGSTTREFGDPAGDLYSAGGQGGTKFDKAVSGLANTGNGGQGACNKLVNSQYIKNTEVGLGGSGIIIIRKHKE